MKDSVVRIGSRGSELALWQARWVQQELARLHPSLHTEIVIIRTTGDKVLDAPLSAVGDKGLFTREIEHALLAGDVDLAVHSLKDLPTELPDGLTIGAVCKREDVRDVFIPHPANPRRLLLDQAPGATIATGSPRRKCQILCLRRDFEIADIRGNINTRLKKLGESRWAGMVLASAGIVRLGYEHMIGETIDADVVLPAVGQGALGVEIRTGDRELNDLVADIRDLEATQATTAERSLLRRLEGGCQIPVGAYGRVVAGKEGVPELQLDAVVGSLSGDQIVRGKTHGDPEEADLLGRHLAETLLAAGAEKILDDIRKNSVTATNRIQGEA